MPKHLHEVAPTPTEHKEIAGMWIARQRLLHLQGEAIHAAAHVGMARRDPHPHTGGNGNHRRGIAFITAAARSGSTAPEIRKRMPRPNSSSMRGMLAGTVGGTAGSLGSGPAIATGVKPIDYMLKRWTAFTRFPGDGRICLSNNAAERALRGLALGRKCRPFPGPGGRR